MTKFLAWIDTLGEFWIYLAVLTASCAENMFTPLPGDTVTVFGAYLAGLGKASPAGIYTASTIGGTIGFMGLFYIGRFFIKKGERKGTFFGINLEGIERAGQSFEKWGYALIVFNRFLYGIRFAVALFAGVTKLDPWKTAAAAFISTALWNIVLVYLGVTLGENWDGFKEILWKYNRIIIPAVLTCFTAYFIFSYVKHKKNCS